MIAASRRDLRAPARVVEHDYIRFERADHARPLGQAAGGRVDNQAVFQLLALTSLTWLPVVLTLTLFISVLMTLSRAYRDSEMVVWFASGLSLAAWIRPVARFAAPLVALMISSIGVSPARPSSSSTAPGGWPGWSMRTGRPAAATSGTTARGRVWGPLTVAVGVSADVTVDRSLPAVALTVRFCTPPTPDPATPLITRSTGAYPAAVPTSKVRFTVPFVLICSAAHCGNRRFHRREFVGLEAGERPGAVYRER